MNKYKFLGSYAWNEPFEQEFATDEEALQLRFRPDLLDGKWHASVWKLVNNQWLEWNEEAKDWIGDEFELEKCEQCDEEAWDGYICHNCGAKNI